MTDLKKLGNVQHVTYVTTHGLKRNSYAKNVQSEVILDDLFRF